MDGGAKAGIFKKAVHSGLKFLKRKNNADLLPFLEYLIDYKPYFVIQIVCAE